MRGEQKVWVPEDYLRCEYLFCQDEVVFALETYRRWLKTSFFADTDQYDGAASLNRHMFAHNTDWAWQQTPPPLSDKKLNIIARQLSGHGMTAPVANVLVGGDHQITLVFATRPKKDRQMNFRFSWPSCLVGAGDACRGSARLTLVSSPPLDQRFGAELTRINVEAALQQEQISKAGKVSWKGQLKPLYLPPSGIEHSYEAERVEHGMKRSPSFSTVRFYFGQAHA